ncbi:hypothetical protein OC835_000227 [Tilletia horrida]|nr:hypothetical protein OC835_000227 [Tilletia horrida]
MATELRTRQRSRSHSHGHSHTPGAAMTTCSLTILRPAAAAAAAAAAATAPAAIAGHAAAQRRAPQPGAAATNTRFGPDMAICEMNQARSRGGGLHTPSEHESETETRRGAGPAKKMRAPLPQDQDVRRLSFSRSFGPSSNNNELNLGGGDQQADSAHNTPNHHHNEPDHHVQVHLIGDPDILLPFLDRAEEASELILHAPANAALKQRLHSCLAAATVEGSSAAGDGSGNDAGDAWDALVRTLSVDRDVLSDLDWLERLRSIVAPKSLELWSSLERCLGAQCLLYMYGRHDAIADRAPETLACKSWLDGDSPADTDDSNAIATDTTDDDQLSSDSPSAPFSVRGAPAAEQAAINSSPELLPQDLDDDVGSGFVLRSFKDPSASFTSSAASSSLSSGAGASTPSDLTSSSPQRIRPPVRRHSSGYQHTASTVDDDAERHRLMLGSMQFEVLHDVPATFKEKVGNLRHTSRIELEENARQQQQQQQQQQEGDANQREGEVEIHHLLQPHQPPPQSYSPVKLRSALHLPPDECPEGASLTDIVEEVSPKEQTSGSMPPAVTGPTANSKKAAERQTPSPASMPSPPVRRLSTCLSHFDRRGSNVSGSDEGRGGSSTPQEVARDDDGSRTGADELDAFMLANEGRFAGFRISTAFGEESSSHHQAAASVRTSVSEAASDSQRSSWVSHTDDGGTAPSSIASSPALTFDSRSRMNSVASASTSTDGEPMRAEKEKDKERKIHFSRHHRLSNLLTSPSVRPAGDNALVATGSLHAAAADTREARAHSHSHLLGSVTPTTSGSRQRRAATSAGILLGSVHEPSTATSDDGGGSSDAADRSEGNSSGHGHPHRATASEMAHRFSQHLRHLKMTAPPAATSPSPGAGAHRRRASEAGTSATPRIESSFAAAVSSGTAVPTPSPGGALMRPSGGGFYGQGEADSKISSSTTTQRGFQLGQLQSGALGQRRGLYMQEAGVSLTPPSVPSPGGGKASSPPAHYSTSSGTLSPLLSEEQQQRLAADQRRRSLSFALNFGGLTLTPQRRAERGSNASLEASPRSEMPVLVEKKSPQVEEGMALPPADGASPPGRAASPKAEGAEGKAGGEDDIDNKDKEGPEDEEDLDDENDDTSPAELAALAESAGLDKHADLGLLPDGRTRHPFAASASSTSHRGSRGSRGSRSSLGSRSGSDSAPVPGAGGSSKSLLAFRAGLKSLGRSSLSAGRLSPAVAHESDEEGEEKRRAAAGGAEEAANVGGEHAQQEWVVPTSTQVSASQSQSDTTHAGGAPMKKRNVSSSSQVKTPTILSSGPAVLPSTSSATTDLSLAHGTPTLRGSAADVLGPATDTASATATAIGAPAGAMRRASYFGSSAGAGERSTGVASQSQPVPPVHTAAVAAADLAVPSLAPSGAKLVQHLSHVPDKADTTAETPTASSTSDAKQGFAASASALDKSTGQDPAVHAKQASAQQEFQRHLETIQRRAQLTGGGRSGFALGGGFSLPKPTGTLHRPSTSGTPLTQHQVEGSGGGGYRKSPLSPGSIAARLGVRPTSPTPSGAQPQPIPSTSGAMHWPYPSSPPRASQGRPLEAVSLARYARERGLDPTGQYRRARAHSTTSDSAFSTGSQAIASSEGSTVGAPEDVGMGLMLVGAGTMASEPYAPPLPEVERSLSPRGGRGELLETPMEGESDEEVEMSGVGEGKGKGAKLHPHPRPLSAAGGLPPSSIKRSGTLRAARDGGPAAAGDGSTAAVAAAAAAVRHVHYVDDDDDDDEEEQQHGALEDACEDDARHGQLAA